MTAKKIFVTVGTTQFDDLIYMITSDDILKELNKKGYNQLLLQIGKTDIDIDTKPRCGFKSIDYFHTKPSLIDCMSNADLIISHAGAGTCLEVLGLKKLLIVVINEKLMNNHQVELAEQLYKDGFLYYTKCSQFKEMLNNMEIMSITEFKGDKSAKIAKTIDLIMG